MKDSTMKDGWTNEQIVEWITIITIFAFVSYPHEMIYLSETSLGKLFFAMAVIYYTAVDPVYGLLACSMVIVYYHLDLYNSYVSLHRDTLLRESMIAMEESITATPETMIENYAQGRSDVYSYIPHDAFTNKNESFFSSGTSKPELLSFFRKEHCDKNGKLIHQGIAIRPEMADHVFREIRFHEEYAKCNPCDPTCQFSIIEERMSKEDSLVRPVSSNEEPFEWDQFFGHYVVTPMTSIADDAKLLSGKFSKYFGQFQSGE
jgi:hypothetical protein